MPQADQLTPLHLQWFQLGAQLHKSKRWSEAESIYCRILALQPNVPEVHYNLGSSLKSQGKYEQAIAAFTQAVALRPNFPEACNNLGNTLREFERPAQAIEVLRRAVALREDYALAWNNLAVALKCTGQLDEALACLDRAIALRPDQAEPSDNRLYSLCFHPQYDPAAIYHEARQWNRQFALPLQQEILPHHNNPSPDRRLRIGYLSPDFRRHCQALFTPTLLAHHDHQQFQIFCYSSVPTPDAVTARLQPLADVWRDISTLSDDQAAQLIRQDQIDILVDLTLHMTNNRLLVFARKPAPVQVTWLGYPGTTGLDAIDYRLTDPRLDPPGSNEPEIRNPKPETRINDPNPNVQKSNDRLDHPGSLGHGDHWGLGALGFGSDFGLRISDFSTQESFYSERSLYLPDTFWCYEPRGMEETPEAQMPEPGPLPALTAGYVTFGCLNNFCKINDSLLELWAQVLIAVPHSQLLLLAPPGPHRERVVQKLGVASNRVQFVPLQPRRQYLETYHRIDLCLDTLPANGHTTSLDALWMGVPVVTILGHTALGRGGASQLYNLGLTELVAHSDQQFIKLAAELAGDLDRLKVLRSTLRQRMERSPLMDGPRFAGHVQDAFRLIWRNWCQTRSSQ